MDAQSYIHLSSIMDDLEKVSAPIRPGKETKRSRSARGEVCLLTHASNSLQTVSDVAERE